MDNITTDKYGRVTFNIQCTMDPRWVDDFCSMLRRMEFDGHIGHSEFVSIFCDGDGDFRPEFQFGIDYKETEAKNCTDFVDNQINYHKRPFYAYDAG